MKIGRSYEDVREIKVNSLKSGFFLKYKVNSHIIPDYILKTCSESLIILTSSILKTYDKELEHRHLGSYARNGRYGPYKFSIIINICRNDLLFTNWLQHSKNNFFIELDGSKLSMSSKIKGSGNQRLVKSNRREISKMFFWIKFLQEKNLQSGLE